MSTTTATNSSQPALLELRDDFPIFDQPLPNGKLLAYLDSGATAQKPRSVMEAVTECYSRYYSNVHRGNSQLGRMVTEAVESSREKVRALLNAKSPHEIVFTAGTTASINMVASAWGEANIGEGDEIVLTEMEHHANLVPWQMLAVKTGAKLRFLPLTDTWEIDETRIDEVITSQTKLVAITGLSNVLGTIPPVEKIVEVAHRVGAVVLVDAAQSVPHTPTDVQELDVDFLAFSGHKLYGPTGVGVLYGKREHLESMPPFLGGGNMIERVYLDHATYAEPPARFEAGTPAIAEIIGLGAAIDYVNQIGWDAIAAHEHYLGATAHERLSEVPGLTIYGPPPERKGAICSFTIEGAHAEDLNFFLDREGIAVRHGHHCTMPLHDKLGVPATIRASFGIYNSPDEIDKLVEALHTARKKLRLG
ncbi:aminotransferase class V-fold PLP-dependent enzyme [Calycomorphotria hydatis]|uniref:Cysteine desulfurase n=1 Tax=Calycomorphotria hydatis TaxID=2528027 RepID=A0A517TAD2_9PLAN|nr:cysteine desulfurase [Calycomorphotria hydatis]QDT65332.1 putative cysteine desulfurase [Calycomorphotria hydatis]